MTELADRWDEEDSRPGVVPVRMDAKGFEADVQPLAAIAAADSVTAPSAASSGTRAGRAQDPAVTGGAVGVAGPQEMGAQPLPHRPSTPTRARADERTPR
ncbi:hypothetical protein ACIG3E_28885 [Streptomyces sp. NPDC053474]|uniref:hypothetical protein n=1 Tax=Streptomyces sp. NPDC053474 TaxID=3365704 RepID=UPI0037CEE08A